MKIDCKGLKIGKLIENLAIKLRGLDSLSFDPTNLKNHLKNLETIEILNSNELKVTNKKYHFHSGYPGNFKSIFAKDLLIKNPRTLIKKAL